MARTPGNQHRRQAKSSARRGAQARQGSAVGRGAQTVRGTQVGRGTKVGQRAKANRSTQAARGRTAHRNHPGRNDTKTARNVRRTSYPVTPAQRSIPPEVYWRRRLIALLIMFATIGLIVWGVKSVISYVNAVKAEQAEAARIQAYQERIIEPVPCEVDNLNIGVATRDAELATGKDTKFTITFHNPSKEQPCTMNVGAASVGVVVKTGDVKVYDSIECASAKEKLPILLGPKRSYSRAYPWSAKKYDDKCKVGNNLKPGTYRVSFRVGDNVDKNEIPFIIK